MEIPAAYAATLAHVCAVFPDSLLAGGCLRDLDNGRPVKDIDIFAPNAGSSFEEVREKVGKLVPDSALIGVMGGYENWATEEVLGVFDIAGPHSDYQLITLSSGPDSILPRLDFGICQIASDGSSVFRTDAYERDKANQTFTLVRCDDAAQYDRSLKRFQRLSEKYQGWKLVDPSSPASYAALLDGLNDLQP